MLMNNLIMTYGLSADQNSILKDALTECVISNVDDAFTDILAVPAVAVIINMEKISLRDIRSIEAVFRHDFDTVVSCVGTSNIVFDDELAFLHIKEDQPERMETTIVAIKERMQLPDQLEAAKKRMHVVIERITKNINCDPDASLRTQIAHIDNTCAAYERISTILENKEELKLRARYPYRVSMDSVIFAMMIAHDLMEESVLEDEELPIAPEKEWIVSLAKDIREHFYKDVKLNRV